MANYAALIQSLAISGSRKSDGTANASGKVYAYLPDTSTTVSLYADAAATVIVTQPIILDTGGRIPQADYPDGVFTKQPVRLLVQDSTGGTTVSDSVFVPSTAGATGYNPNQTNAAFTRTNVNDILQDAGLSFGGHDWNYLISTGQTEIKVKDAITAISVNVKAFGAKGDGIATDTIPCQAAINFVKAAGGGVVYFPPGTYLIDQALTLTSGNGARFVGAGMGSTTITSTHGTANIFTVTSSNDVTFEGLRLTNSSVSTGAAISVSGAVRLTLSRLNIDKFRNGLSATSSTSFVSIYDCLIAGATADASARALLFNATTEIVVVGGTITPGGGTYIIEFLNGTHDFAATGVSLQGVVRFDAALTLGSFSFVGCPMTGAPPSIASATDVGYRTFNCGLDGYSTNVTTGGTVTPDRQQGNDIRIIGTTTGSAYTINAPTPTPLASAFNTTLMIQFVNSAAAPITGWTLNGAYHVSAAPSTVDGERTVYLFRWDGSLSVWRQVSRQVTT